MRSAASARSSHRSISPIAIPKPLSPIEFAYQPIPLTVTDTGHCMQVNVPPGSGGITVGDAHYELVQFHFHRPSEESIHGKRLPAGRCTWCTKTPRGSWRSWPY